MALMQGLAASCAGLSSIIACCAQLGQWEQAYGAWSLMQMSGMQPDAACLNALLAALQAAQQWQHVIQVFQAARQAQVRHTALLCLCWYLLQARPVHNSES